MKEKVCSWIKKNKKIFSLIILCIYTILFGISSFVLRINGFDFLSYIYKFNFWIISLSFILLSVLIMSEELDMKKVSSWLALFGISIFEGIFFLIMSFFLIFELDIGNDHVKSVNGNYYVESNKITGGGMDERYSEKNEYICGFIKRIK